MSDYPDLEFTIVGGKLAQPTKPDETIPMIPNQAAVSEDPVIASEVVTTSEVSASDETPEVPVTIAETESAEETSGVAEVSQIDEVLTTDEVSEESISYRQDFVAAVRHAFNMRLVTKQGLCRALSIAPMDEPVADELIKDMVQCSVIQELEGADGVFRTIISTLPEVEESHRRFDEHATASDDDDDDDDDDSDEVGAIAPSIASGAVVAPIVVTPPAPMVPPAAPATPIPPAAAPVVPRGTISRNGLFSILGLVLAVIFLNITVIITRPQNAGFLPIFDILVAALILAVLKPELYSRAFLWLLTQARGGRRGKMIAGGAALGVLILVILAVSQLSCDKHQGGAKYGKIEARAKGMGPASAPAKSDSTKIDSMADSLATLKMNTEAFTAALRVLEQPGDYRMATDADPDDQYNMPHLVWTRFMEEAHSAGKTWNYGGDFYPAARDTVMQWWVRSQFVNGETVETLAPRWINRIKGLDVPPDTAKVYGYRLIIEYLIQVEAMKDDGTFDSYKRSTKNILIPNPVKEEKKQQSKATISRIVILVAGLLAILLALSSFFHGKKLTKGMGALAFAAGAITFGVLGAYTVAPMTENWMPAWTAVMIMALIGAAFAIGYFKR